MYGHWKDNEYYTQMDDIEQDESPDINEAMEIIIAHIFMCAEALKQSGFTCDNVEKFI